MTSYSFLGFNWNVKDTNLLQIGVSTFQKLKKMPIYVPFSDFISWRAQLKFLLNPHPYISFLLGFLKKFNEEQFEKDRTNFNMNFNHIIEQLQENKEISLKYQTLDQ